MKPLYTLLLLLCFTACTPSLNKALHVALKDNTNATVTQTRLNSSYPLIVAHNAATLFPVREKVITKTDTIRKTVTLPGEVLECPETVDTKTGKVYTPTVKCPDHTYEQQTIKELTERTQESTAKVEALTLEREAARDTVQVRDKTIKEQQGHIKDIEKENRTYFWGLIIAGLVVAGLVVLKVLKPF
jgi:hypothetical protein